MATIVASWFRSRWASAACLAIVVAALLLPPHGLGVPVCHFRSVTGIPCWACGLTRSFIGMAHGDLARAAFFHPLGLVLFPFTVLVAALLAVPAPRREALARWAERRAAWVNGFAWCLLVVFAVYGLGRMVWLFQSRQPSPW